MWWERKSGIGGVGGLDRGLGGGVVDRPAIAAAAAAAVTAAHGSDHTSQLFNLHWNTINHSLLTVWKVHLHV